MNSEYSFKSCQFFDKTRLIRLAIPLLPEPLYDRRSDEISLDEIERIVI